MKYYSATQEKFEVHAGKKEEVERYGYKKVKILDVFRRY